MSCNPRRACALFCALVISTTSPAHGQARAGFTIDQILDYPFPDHLVAARSGSLVAWTFAERGVRNIYVAEGPDFKARRVTPYQADDGQELTFLAFSNDAKRIVYVRGGDHGANWPAEGGLQPDPASNPVQQKMQVWSVPVAGGPPALLGDGDEPDVSSTGVVAFVANKKIWTAPIDGSKPAEALFFARGSSETPRWSPDGHALAFVSNREDHSFIGIYTDSAHPLRYVAATTSRDSDPAWSPDGKSIAFVRRPGRGGAPRSPLQQQPQPWSIWIGAADGPPSSHQLWASGNALVDSLPRTADDRILRWAAGDRLVFFSYQDGWPHLYSMTARPGGGSAPRPDLLTKGPFMVEHVDLTPDRRFIVYSANTGTDPLDVDRRHIFKVAVDGSSAPAAVTSGSGLEWMPVATGDGRSIAFLGSDAQRSPLPAVVSTSGGSARRLAEDRVPAGFPAAQLVTPQQVIFKSPDGVEIHGQLFKPGNPSSGRSPALVYVHGGPPRQMLLGWHYMDYYANDYGTNQFLASRGFVVLSVNYRLGIGYGHAFQYPERGGARGASEYLDVLAGGKYLQSRPDVDSKRIGIWGGSYGGYLTALALGRNSDVFAAGVDIHGVHDRLPSVDDEVFAHALVGDGIKMADYEQALKVAYESSPISAVATWKSPVLLIHGDDDRNVKFSQTVDLERRLLEKGVDVESLVIPDDIHDFLLWRSWRTVAGAAGAFFERQFLHSTTRSQQQP
ncbi:MAG TPA: prolyl oligopeptidase family serine peptidase [Vicinamibacterales bacterium]|jgi:dipeptidyl aminopeptidase/acylaminoacyl peptidase